MPEVEHAKLNISGVSFEDGMAFGNASHIGGCIIKDGEIEEFNTKRDPIPPLTFPILNGLRRLSYMIRSSLPLHIKLDLIRNGKVRNDNVKPSVIIGILIALVCLQLITIPHVIMHIILWIFGCNVSLQVFNMLCGLWCSTLFFYVIVSRKFVKQENAKYHGAEHMCAQAYEAGEPLTPQVLRKYSHYHPRCGTSLVTLFALVIPVMFYFIPWGGVIGILAKTLTFLIALGFSLDLFRALNLYAPFMLFFGVWLQRFTVTYPETRHIELAIRAMNVLRNCGY
jgi:uncharacterized protein YqhQ